ncbi:hypothetical protein BpHYR1_022013 [Brachionus plicatilis]|uniref:Uncharacterized protein n=1 Tax=Brachionus plicatilis TaxID=10195 RepID=A0A3M7PND1_BRAPC|nr:hypothetical protein BpHYR1_022013 [Brachionus plicatilis]
MQRLTRFNLFSEAFYFLSGIPFKTHRPVFLVRYGAKRRCKNKYRNDLITVYTKKIMTVKNNTEPATYVAILLTLLSFI